MSSRQPAVAPPSFPETRLVSAKLAPRPGAARTLSRPRLTESLDRASAARLVLVRAPAGFGKTTFLVEHFRRLRQRGLATAWLTLDEADNDVSRFLAHALAAFQSIDPTLGLIVTGTAHAGGAGQDPAGAAIDLVHHVSMQNERFAMFLDNLEAVQAETVIGVIRTLVEALPPSGQMIVATREAPKLGLGRLRAHGQLVEVTQDMLRFSLDESAALLRDECGLPLDDGEIAMLHRRTQGWAAALWLAALALRNHRDPAAFVRSFGGSHAAVADYLLDDVLSRLPDDSRSFLLSVSVLDDLNPELCDLLTQRGDSARMLAALERAGLFVIPQGPDERSYRFHPLFRDFLRIELSRSDPDAPAALLHEAADWHLAQGRHVQAVEHLIRAGDQSAAATLLAPHAERLLSQGRVLLLTRFLDNLPSVTHAGSDAGLQCVYAWALLLTHRYREALGQFERVEAVRGTDVSVGAHLAVGRAFILAMADRVAEALDAWEACQDAVDPVAQPFLHSIQQNSFAFCLIAANRFDEAMARLAAGEPSHRRIGSSFNLAVRACLEGAVALARGELDVAVSRCREALAETTKHPGQHVPGSTIAAAFLAEACYAIGAHAEAERLLDAYLPLIDEVAAPDQIITSHVVLARIAWRRGDHAQAAAGLDAMERKGERGELRRLRSSAHLERARLALFGGDLLAAATAIERARAIDDRDPGDELSLHATDVEGLGHATARLMIHSGRAESALMPLRTAIARAESQGRRRRTLHLQVLLALALDRSGQSAAAEAMARDVAARCLACGSSVAVEDEGPLAIALVSRAQRVYPGAPGAGGLPPLRGTAAEAERAELTTERRPAPLIEALTGREERILALLAEGHANREIAQRLHVSESTVKTHLRNINAKLGADNRTHAVAIGRRLGLIPEGR